MIWVSAQHETDEPVASWSLDYKINVLASRIDDWHLQVADRCINGWEVDGTPCINTVLERI